MGCVFVLLIAVFAVVFCIRKNKRKDFGGIVSRGSRTAGTNDSEFYFLFSFYVPVITISFYFSFFKVF